MKTMIQEDNYYVRSIVHGVAPTKKFGGTVMLTISEAKKYHISVREIPDTEIFETTYKNNVNYFYGQNPSQTELIGYLGAINKTLGRAFLSEKNLSIPKGFSILKTDPQDYWLEVFQALQKPLVVKPTHGTQGQSVFANIREWSEYAKAVQTCLSYSSESDAGAVVEELFLGKEYRILTTTERVIGIINRVPAHVIGDGSSTIQELIELRNADPRRGDYPDYPIVLKIAVDEHVLSHLQKQGLTLASIPQKDQLVLLRLNSNISTGGDSIDVTDLVHPSVKELALQTISAFPGLWFAGIDFMSTDITAPQTPDNYRIIEVNDSPGFSIHDMPYEGKNRHATYEFLCLLFPELRQDFPEPL